MDNKAAISAIQEKMRDVEHNIYCYERARNISQADRNVTLAALRKLQEEYRQAIEVLNTHLITTNKKP